MSAGVVKPQEIIPELREAIEKLLASDCLSEDMKAVAIQMAIKILDQQPSGDQQ